MPVARDLRPTQRRPLLGYGLALLAAACWGAGGLTAKWLFTAASAATASWPIPPLGISVEPTVLAGGRALSAFVILAVALAVFRRRDLSISVGDVPFLAFFGVAGLAMVHFTYFQTISLTNVATAILLEYLAPILVLIVSVAFMKHRFTWSLPVGVALSVAGCALVVGAFGGGGVIVSPAGIAWGLSSAVFFATYSLLGTVASSRYSPYTTLVWGLGFASLFWLVVLGPWRIIGLFADPRTAVAVLFMAVVSTIIPFAAFLIALGHIAPTNATVTSTVEPVIAGIGAFLLFGESFSAMQMVGGVMVIAAIVIVQFSDRLGAPLPPGE
ncbi:MAG: EamA family transporter [Coriobacteriia bacterium]|nr:EamA family transporter [Coriobacteriia bacterium]